MTFAEIMQSGNGQIAIDYGNTRFNLARIVGPFFLGIVFAAFGTGIVVVLAIRYLRDDRNSWRLKAVIYFVLFANIAQLTADISRGWHMFAVSFMDIQEFLTPPPSFFISPFFGLFPTCITQIFLLRRSHRFLTSLRFLFPTLAHPVTRTLLASFIVLGILLAFATGIGASWEVYNIGNLAMLGQEWPISKPFHQLSRIWLFASSIVDVALCTVLCWELWWARERLTEKDGDEGGLGPLNKGKGSNGILLKLIAVTLHGGIAVTAIQITALALMFTDMWTSGSFAYMLFISIPKVYTITLLLSLSVPQARREKSQVSFPSAIDRALREQSPRQRPSSSSRDTISDPLPPQAFPLEILQGLNAEPVPSFDSYVAKDKGKKKQGGIKGWFNANSRKSEVPKTTVGKGSMEVHTGSVTHRARRASNDTGFDADYAYPQPSFRDYRRPSEPTSVTGLLSPYNMQLSSSTQFGSYPSARGSIDRPPIPFPIPLPHPPPMRTMSRHHASPTAATFEPVAVSRASSTSSSSSSIFTHRRPSQMGAQQLELGGLGPLTETISNASGRSRERTRSPEGGISLLDMLGGGADAQDHRYSPSKREKGG